MTARGELLNRSLSEVRFSPDGGSVQLYLTDTVPPYGTAVLTCSNLLAFHLHRTADDPAPFFLGEVTWQPLTSARQEQTLGRLGYSFLNEGGTILLPVWSEAVHVHFEGSVCGDIICSRCSVGEEGPVQHAPPVGQETLAEPAAAADRGGTIAFPDE
jgi:hypothetical protein